MINRSKTVLVFLILLTILGRGQNTSLKFDQIGLEQGLSQSTINAITEDARGFIWFGTNDGLNRYDGYTIKIYKHDSSDSNSISDNQINFLLSDSNGDLWIGTSNGVNRLILSEEKFRHYIHKENDSLTISNNAITTIFEDSNKNIWIGTKAGLNLYNRLSDSFTRFFFDKVNSLTPNGNSITSICEDIENNIWAGTFKGLYRFNNKNNNTFKKIDNLNTNPVTLYGENVTSLYNDKNGELWVGTFDQPLKRYEKKTDSFHSYKNTITNIKTINEDSDSNLWLGSVNMGLRVLDCKTNKITKIPSIYNDPINIIFKDKSGILWLGTGYRGVFIYNRNRNRFKHYLHDPDNPNVVMAILEDQDGSLWVGTYGNGLKHFNRKRDKLVTYTHHPERLNSISSDKIFTLCQTSDGILWVGTIDGGLNYFDKSDGVFKKIKRHSPVDSFGLSSNDITALYETSDGSLLIGNVSGGIDILNRKKGIISHYYPGEQNPVTIGGGRSVTDFCEDKNGIIWAGTLNGLKRFDPVTVSFVEYTWNNKTRESGNISVTSLFFNEDIMWIGTSGNGLVMYERGSNLLKSYTEKDGLPDNVVLGVLPDNKDNLWISSNKGISRFNIKSETFKNYNINDGLQGKEFNQGAYYKSLSGEMFFGGVNGFNSFFADKIKDNEIIPPIYVTTFNVFDEKVDLPNPIPENYVIELSYAQNFFSFEFVALNYTAPEKNQYAYILEGFDNEWHIVSSQQRYASYTNLDPGEYRLRVKGSNNDGLWNEDGTSIVLIIKPPFWMAWWFRGLGVFLIMLLVYFIYRSRVAKIEREKLLQQEISKRLIEKQEEERQRIALEIHDSLGPNLILIKNRANSSMKNKLDHEAISARFSQISVAATDVISTVREISHNLRPPELDQLGLTETVRSILITARSSTNIEITGEVENIDGLIRRDLEINFVRVLQEALSNVIKHSEANKCEILIKIKDSQILLSIDDNGKGFSLNKDTSRKTNKPGLGLTGMTERVRILGGNFKIETDAGKGTKIRIQIPIDMQKAIN